MARRRKRRGSRIADELSASFDGRTVVYGFGKLDALVPAYAATVHKSHGSEYPAVVIPVLTQHYAMLRRNLLYTGVTRGKRRSYWWARRRRSPSRYATCRGGAGGRGWPHRVPHRFMSMQQEHPRVKKADLASRIADELNITKARAEDAVDAILDEVKLVLSEGEPVILRRFGAFQVRDKRQRLGRNPKTGEEADIPARRVVRFKAGKYFRDAVNDEG